MGESRVGALGLTEEDAGVRTWEGGSRPANETGRLTPALVEIAPGDPFDTKGLFERRTHVASDFVIPVDVGYVLYGGAALQVLIDNHAAQNRTRVIEVRAYEAQWGGGSSMGGQVVRSESRFTL